MRYAQYVDSLPDSRENTIVEEQWLYQASARTIQEMRRI